MNDPALTLLHHQTSHAQALWILPESVDQATIKQLSANAHVSILSNRLLSEQTTQPTSAQACIYFNDFDFSALDKQHHTHCYRIAKEKRLNHHIIEQSAHHLPDDGELFVAGGKKEGIKSLKTFASDYFDTISLKKHKDLYLLHGKNPKRDRDSTSYTSTYQDWISIQTPYLQAPYESKPGIFSYDRLDTGSALLLAMLDANNQNQEWRHHKVLDLGCGAGVLGLYAAEKGAQHITLTDNNATALLAAERNMAKICGTKQSETQSYDCVPAHIGDAVQGRYDLILCNPPFHTGFSHQSSLIYQFLTATARKLRSGGRAWFVVNQFIPLEQTARKVGLGVLSRTTQQNYLIASLTPLSKQSN